MIRKEIPDLDGRPWKVFTGRDAAQVHAYRLHQDSGHALGIGFICRMGRHAIRSNRRVYIWASIFIDAACLFWAHVGFQTQSSRLRGQPGQQVHRDIRVKAARCLEAIRHTVQARMRGGILCCPVMLGSVPKTGRFGLGLAGYLGLLKKPSVTLKHSENRNF